LSTGAEVAALLIYLFSRNLNEMLTLVPIFTPGGLSLPFETAEIINNRPIANLLKSWFRTMQSPHQVYSRGAKKML